MVRSLPSAPAAALIHSLLQAARVRCEPHQPVHFGNLAFDGKCCVRVLFRRGLGDVLSSNGHAFTDPLPCWLVLGYAARATIHGKRVIRLVTALLPSDIIGIAADSTVTPRT